MANFLNTKKLYYVGLSSALDFKRDSYNILINLQRLFMNPLCSANENLNGL